MDINNIAVLAAAAPAIAFWNQIKSGLNQFRSFFITTDEFCLGFTNTDIVSEILSDSKYFRLGNRKITGSYDVKLKSENISICPAVDTRNRFFCFYKGFIPVHISLSLEKTKITYIPKTINFAPLIRKSRENIARNNKNLHFSVEKQDISVSPVSFGGNSRKNVSEPSPSGYASPSPSLEETCISAYDFTARLPEHVNFVGFKKDEICFSESDYMKSISYFWTKEALRFEEEVKFWRDKKDWFTEREISWKRSCCLYGRPGTGKSKMVEEVARKLNIPITVLDISFTNNEKFKNALMYIPAGSIVLIEDIDTVFQGRKNLNQDSQPQPLLSFDAFINELSGVGKGHNFFLVVTTNNKDSLDPALLRAGRLDAKIEVGSLCMEGKKFIASNILRGYDQAIVEVCDDEEISVVEFQNKCIEKAIRILNEEKRINN